MSLDSRWLIRVKDTTSRNPDKLITLEELDNYINTEENDRIRLAEDVIFPADDPDGTSLQERMDALDDTETGAVPFLMARADAVDQQLFETQGMADKLAAIELRKDDIFEILENKSIINPQINEAPVRAYFDIALADATKAVRISAITPGAAANSHSYLIGTTAAPDGVAITYAAPDLGIVLLEDGEGSITTTAYELARLAAVTADFVSNFIISFDDGTPITEDGNGAGVIAATGGGSFANGAGAGHVLTSTGTQIDKTISASPHAIVTIYDTDAAAPYLLDDISQTVVIVNNNGEDIELPVSNGSGIEIRITNQFPNSHDVVVSDSSGDVIDADISISLAQYESCVLVDVLEGTWARF